MSDSVLREKSKDFAKDIVFLCRKLKKAGVEAALVNQLLRSGTSVGANVHEARYAQGAKDFVSKLEIALKECSETEFWFEILYETGSLSSADFESFRARYIELRRMLVASVTTVKTNDRTVASHSGANAAGK